MCQKQLLWLSKMQKDFDYLNFISLGEEYEEMIYSPTVFWRQRKNQAIHTKD